MNRFWAKVDKDGPTMDHMETPCWVWTAAKLKKSKYGVIRVAGKTVYAHRLSWELFSEEAIPHGMKIDHRCRHTSCVNPEHLRLATQKQNMENRTGLCSNNTSGFQGVHRHQVGSSIGWLAEVKHNGQRFYLGRFKTAEEANAAAMAKRLELFSYNDRDREMA